MKEWLYPNCEILRVVDGDTFDVLIDHGCQIFSKTRIRLYKSNAAESYGSEKSELGADAKRYCIKLLEGQKFPILSKERTGKYGRLIADIKLNDGTWLSDDLINKGYAVKMEY